MLNRSIIYSSLKIHKATESL